MTNDKVRSTEEALKLALEALRQIDEAMPFPVAKLAQAAIKEALMSDTDGAQPEQECGYDETTGNCTKESCCRAQPEQEPVTWRYKIVDVFGRPAWTLKTPKSDTRVLESQPLYTTPPQRKPLTDEEIDDVYGKANCDYISIQDSYLFARAIEAAHGIIAPTELKGEA